MENEIDLKELEYDFDNFPNIPKELWEYIVNVKDRNIKEELLPVLMGSSERKVVLEKIDRLFKVVSEILQLSPSEITKALDFHPNDIGEGRIDAFFAELRTISWLHLQKFQNIKSLRAASKKRSDIYAEFNSSKYIVEVFCMIQGNYEWPNPPNRSYDLIQYYITRAEEKKKQIDETAKDFGCDKKILALVLDYKREVALHGRSDFLKKLQCISNRLNWGESYHFALITGMVTSGEGLDDVVYPDI